MKSRIQEEAEMRERAIEAFCGAMKKHRLTCPKNCTMRANCGLVYDFINELDKTEQNG